MFEENPQELEFLAKKSKPFPRYQREPEPASAAESLGLRPLEQEYYYHTGEGISLDPQTSDPEYAKKLLLKKITPLVKIFGYRERDINLELFED